MAKDPYRYFRVEAPELVEKLAQGVLALEKQAPTPDAISHLLRLAHTLKGAARVVKQAEIAELAHRVEGQLSGCDGSAPLPQSTASELLGIFDRVTALLQALGSGATADARQPASGAGPAGATEDATVAARIEIGELDALQRSVAEAIAQVGALHRNRSAAARLRELARGLSEQLAIKAVGGGPTLRARALCDELHAAVDQLARDLSNDVERVDGGLSVLQEAVHRLRLVAAHTVFPALDRAVRDAAQVTGREVALEVEGGDVELDASVLGSVRDALVQVVRNAVAHGIEPAAARLALGKPARGRIRLVVARQGNRVSFACHDDGRGVDLEAVRSAAARQGLAAPAAMSALTDGQLLELLQNRGLSTSTQVTELSGRGIGLDVVRATAARLKGEFRIRSEATRGTVAELLVPISIAVLKALVLQVADGAPVIPLDSVRQTLRLPSDQIATSARSQSIVFDGEVIPFMPLERLLPAARTPSRAPRVWSAVVVRGGARHVALGVERLLGTDNVVMRPVPQVIEPDAVVAGAYLDTMGNPQLVLDPAGLVTLAERDVAPQRAEPAKKLAPVLIVDDSLTTRMLEQSILESAGYEVELAVSAEDALEKARPRRHCLFIVDVEMPGIDGFELVSRIRADPELRDIPAILVTSRNAPEDRRKGEQSGAQAYIVKGEFDQGLLLKTIRRLVG